MLIIKPALSSKRAHSLRFLTFVLGALLLANPGWVVGQSYSTHLVMDPATGNLGDTVSFEVHLETQSPVNGFVDSYYLDPAQFDLEQLTATKLNSALGNVSDLALEALVDGDSVQLDLHRLDDETKSVDGIVARLGGIILVDDLHTKRAPENDLHPRFRLFPQPARTQVQLTGTTALERIQLVRADGSLISLPVAETIDVSQLLPGIYFLLLHTQQGEVVRKPLWVQ